MMPKINQIPRSCKRFFRRARKIVGACHSDHLVRIVILLASLHGRRSLSKFEKATGKRRSRQALSHFLTRAEWDAPELLQQSAADTLRQLGWRAGDLLYIILDDTQKRKRAKRMDAVRKLFLHAEKIYAPGHTIVGCVLLYRGVVIPYAVRLWAPEDFCRETQQLSYGEKPVEFRKITELAAEMLAGVELPSPGQAIVLFDSYYLCSTVTRACKARRFPYVGVAKKNRNFFPDGRDRDKRKLGRYGANALRRHGRTFTVQGKKYHLAERVGRLSKAGAVKLVVSRRIRERAWIVMATDRQQWSAKTVLSHYLKRWGIEVFFKMSKQNLGLGDYQFLRYRAVERYLHLVLLAYLLLTHLALSAPDVQANIKKRKQVLRLPSMAQLQQHLRETLWREVLQNLEKRPRQCKITRIIKELLQLCC
jgi:SRSO17 transposase